MDGMDDMNAPMPPMDAEQGMPPAPEDPNAMGGEEPVDPVAGGPNDDPLAGDPNSLNTGEGNAPEGYDQLTNKGKAAVDAYTKSIADEENGGQDSNEMQPDMGGQMPPAPGAMPESRRLFGKIIDETINSIKGKKDTGMKRPEKGLSKKYRDKKDNPFVSPY